MLSQGPRLPVRRGDQAAAQDPELLRVLASFDQSLGDESLPKELSEPLLLARKTYVTLRNQGSPSSAALASAYSPLTHSCQDFLAARFQRAGVKVANAATAVPFFYELRSLGVSPIKGVFCALSPALRAAWGGLPKALSGEGALAGVDCIKRQCADLISAGEKELALIRFIDIELLGAQLSNDFKPTLSKLTSMRQQALLDIAGARDPEAHAERAKLKLVNDTHVLYLDLVCGLRASFPALTAAECNTQAVELTRLQGAAAAMAKVLALADSFPQAESARLLRASFVAYVLRFKNMDLAAETACGEFKGGEQDGNLYRGGRGGNGTRGGGGKGTGSSEKSG